MVLLAALIIGVAAGETRNGRLFGRGLFDRWIVPQDIAIEFDRVDSGWRFRRESSYPDSSTIRGIGVVYVRPTCYLRLSTDLIAPLYEQWSVELQFTNAERFGNVATTKDRQELMAAAAEYLATHHAGDPWVSIFKTNRYAYRIYWPGIGYNALSLLQVTCVLVMVTAFIRFMVATRAELLARNRCLNCDYSLAGLRDPVCPECGEPVVLAE